MKNIVIIGSSAAGHSLALQLRSRDKSCSITVVTEEAYPHYDRRKLLAYFSGSVKEKELSAVAADVYSRENIILVREAKAAGINCDRGKLSLKKEEKQESISFDLMAICTGMKVVRGEVPGIRKEGIFTLDSLADAKAAKAVVISGPVCLFGEWNSRAKILAQLFLDQKKEVRLIIDQAADVLPGVEVINSVVSEFIGESGLQAVKLKEGKIIGTSFCVLTSPLVPSTEFLNGTGLVSEGGFIAVDSGFRTSRQNIFACGSVTGKCDSWEDAVKQGSSLGDIFASLLAGDVPRGTSL